MTAGATGSRRRCFLCSPLLGAHDCSWQARPSGYSWDAGSDLVCFLSDLKLMIVLGFNHSLCATQRYSQVLRVYMVAILWVTENNQRCEQWDAAAGGKHQKCGAINNFGCTRSQLICSPRDNSDRTFQRPWHRESCYWICPSKFPQCLLAISVTPTCLVV